MERRHPAASAREIGGSRGVGQDAGPNASGAGTVAGRPVRWCALLLLVISACTQLPELPQEPVATPLVESTENYRIAPGDELNIFVWQDRDLSLNVKVRPDGRISMPLIQEVRAAGRTPEQLADELEAQLQTYVQAPVVTVIVANYVGPLDQQVRVIGEATEPQSLTYRPDMTVLDALIAVGGLTEFADGNRAVVIREVAGKPSRYRVRLEDLLQDGDITANAALIPGDVLIIPEALF
jgi:polysaccharide export outer membrane protein